jgi:VWA domain-containing protein
MMKIYRFEMVLALALLCLCWTSVLAQQSGSAASVSRARALVNAGPNTYYPPSPSYNSPPPVFRVPEEVAVEEFVNYHKHRLPLPKVGQAVAMDTRWGNFEVSRSQREAILQIGFTTAEVNERTDLRPLNLVFVIDKSGSMADSDKMSRVKDGLRTMVGKMRPDDIVSIVTFDTTAQVLYPARPIGNADSLRNAIERLQ